MVNPLYSVSLDGSRSVLTLTFPTPQYEEEFGECRRYLPDALTLSGDFTAPVLSLAGDVDVEDLRRRRVLIDAPPRYC
jgi:hypothetical protein